MKHTSKVFTLLALFTLLPTAAHAASPMHVVSAGDTLSKIARENQTTVSLLMQVNHLGTDQLSIGQTLSLPEAGLSDSAVEAAPPDLVGSITGSSHEEAEEITAGEKARVAVDVLNVRKKPSLDARVLGKLRLGSLVEVLETGSEWTKIEYEDDEAYVATSYLSAKLSAAPGLSGEVDAVSLGRLEAIFQPLLKTPYIFGGTTPNGFDCSGFTSYVFNQLGVTLPRTSEDQFKSGQAIPLDEAQPGDLLFYDTDGTGRVSHVAIYLGNGEMVHASGEDVRYGKVEYMHKLYKFYGVKRYLPVQ